MRILAVRRLAGNRAEFRVSGSASAKRDNRGLLPHGFGPIREKRMGSDPRRAEPIHNAWQCQTHGRQHYLACVRVLPAIELVQGRAAVPVSSTLYDLSGLIASLCAEEAAGGRSICYSGLRRQELFSAAQVFENLLLTLLHFQ